MSKDRGFTLVELIVALAMFTIIIGIPLSLLIRELKSTVRQTNLSQSSLEKVVFASIIRRDIQQAGYGLAWDVNGVTFSDTTTSVPEYTASLSVFNVSPPTVPKAIDGLRDTSGNGFSYLVLRATTLGFSKAIEHWTYIDKNGYVTVWPDNSSKQYDNFQQGDNAIVLNAANRRIVPNSATGTFYFTILHDFTPAYTSASYYGLPTGIFGSNYLVYGISHNTTPTMPYNRVDYYLHRPATMPKNCAPGTYILYRNASYPVLSCVADFQVGFGLDTNNDGVIDSWTQDLTSLSALQVREQLKQVRVYILVQNGVFDPDYVYPYTSVYVGNPSLGTSGIGRNFTFSGITDFRHYRWKLIRLVVQPKNLGEY